MIQETAFRCGYCRRWFIDINEHTSQSHDGPTRWAVECGCVYEAPYALRVYSCRTHTDD